MDFMKARETLGQLYRYGEAPVNKDNQFLEEQGLLYELEGSWVVTRSWITYGYLFTRRDEFINSLFLFNRHYLDYLLHWYLITGLKMRESNDLNGINEFVSRLPNLAGQALFILKNYYPGPRQEFPAHIMENKVEVMSTSYRELDQHIFNGEPGYQRISFYLDKVQQYAKREEPEDKPLGSTIDEMWERGRKISTLEEERRRDKPLTVLVPFKEDMALKNPVFQEILSNPWQLLLLLLGVVREQFEVQGQRALLLRPGVEGTEVIVTTFKNKEYLYGTLNQFLAVFCRDRDYALFPAQLPDGQNALNRLLEKGVFILKDGEYRIKPEVEDMLYVSGAGLTFISKSKKLRTALEKFIDRLRK